MPGGLLGEEAEPSANQHGCTVPIALQSSLRTPGCKNTLALARFRAEVTMEVASANQSSTSQPPSQGDLKQAVSVSNVSLNDGRSLCTIELQAHSLQVHISAVPACLSRDSAVPISAQEKGEAGREEDPFTWPAQAMFPSRLWAHRGRCVAVSSETRSQGEALTALMPWGPPAHGKGAASVQPFNVTP